jgi:hypothetical protein
MMTLERPALPERDLGAACRLSAELTGIAVDQVVAAAVVLAKYQPLTPARLVRFVLEAMTNWHFQHGYLTLVQLAESEGIEGLH